MPAYPISWSFTSSLAVMLLENHGWHIAWLPSVLFLFCTKLSSENPLTAKANGSFSADYCAHRVGCHTLVGPSVFGFHWVADHQVAPVQPITGIWLYFDLCAIHLPPAKTMVFGWSGERTKSSQLHINIVLNNNTHWHL